MRTFDSRCYSGERTEAIKEELDSKNVETDKEDNVYKQIASAYNMGTSFYMSDQFKKAIPYLDKSHATCRNTPGKKKNTSTKNSLPGEYVLHTPKQVRTKKL